jgi:hypothetical protein
MLFSDYRTHVRRQVQNLNDDNERLTMRVEALEHRLARVRGAIEDLLYVHDPMSLYDQCKYCGATVSIEHAPDCAGAALLALFDGDSTAEGA